jgi:hypothetical protein
MIKYQEMKMASKLFERRSEWDSSGRRYTSHYAIRCHGCGESDMIRFNRFNQSLPPDVIAKQFHHRGWVIGQTRKNDLCPKCVTALTRDKDRRKGVGANEKKRAFADVVIGKSKALPVPMDDDVTGAKREHYVLIDRMAEVERQEKYLEAMVEELLNQVADLRTEHSAIMRRLAGEALPAPEQQQEPEMFTPLPTGRSESALSRDRDRCFISYTASRSIIKIGRNIADQLSLHVGSNVQILRGDGSDEGYIQVVPSSNGEGYKLRTFNKSADYNSLTLGSSYLRPAGNDEIAMTEMDHSITDNGLRLRLPAAYH